MMVAVKNRSRFEMFERLGFFVEILVAQVPKKESCTKPKQKTRKVVAKSKKTRDFEKNTPKIRCIISKPSRLHWTAEESRPDGVFYALIAWPRTLVGALRCGRRMRRVPAAGADVATVATQQSVLGLEGGAGGAGWVEIGRRGIWYDVIWSNLLIFFSPETRGWQWLNFVAIYSVERCRSLWVCPTSWDSWITWSKIRKIHQIENSINNHWCFKNCYECLFYNGMEYSLEV